MKTLISIIALSSSILFYACSENKTETIQPQIVQKTTNVERNLRPTANRPDLDVYPFFQNGAVTINSTAGYYKIPVSFKEHNIGTQNSAAYTDSLKVYQIMPFTGVLRPVSAFFRPTKLLVGGTYFLNDIVRFPIAWRPASGKIDLIIKADGSNNIIELDETNNFSNTILGIPLP